LEASFHSGLPALKEE